MTHWKRALLLFWGIVALFLVILGIQNTNSATRLHFRFFKDWQSLTVYDGEISYSKHPYFIIGKASTTPAIRIERVPITKRTPDDLFKSYFASASGPPTRFSPFYFYEKNIAAASLPTLFLLHTAFFSLLYHLAHRHYRKKTTAPPVR